MAHTTPSSKHKVQKVQNISLSPIPLRTITKQKKIHFLRSQWRISLNDNSFWVSVLILKSEVTSQWKLSWWGIYNGHIAVLCEMASIISTRVSRDEPILSSNRSLQPWPSVFLLLSLYGFHLCLVFTQIKSVLAVGHSANCTLLIEHGQMHDGRREEVGWRGGGGGGGERASEHRFRLIKILFQWLNPFLMCVFSEARQRKPPPLSVPQTSLSYLSLLALSALSPSSLSCIM